MKHYQYLYLLCFGPIFFLNSCGAPSGTTAQTKRDLVKAAITPADTVVFAVSNAGHNAPLDFDDNNTLTPGSGITLKATEKGEDNYELTVTKGDKPLRSLDSIMGVSKVLVQGDELLFSVFKETNEDGGNQGFGYIYNTRNNKLKRFKDTLRNTANPVRCSDKYYFLNGQEIIQTDIDLHVLNKIFFKYFAADKSRDYLDTYSVHGLTASGNGKLQIIFTPDKSSTKPQTYEGTVNERTQIIILQDKKIK